MGAPAKSSGGDGTLTFADMAALKAVYFNLDPLAERVLRALRACRAVSPSDEYPGLLTRYSTAVKMHSTCKSCLLCRERIGPSL